MGYLSYDGLTLAVESFQRFDQRAVYSDDGTDYLYTEFTVVVRSFWHPKGTASTPNSSSAAVSMDALRSRFLAPRKQLIISAPVGGAGGSSVFLRSPLLRASGTSSYVVDAKNGPQPLFCNIQQIVGEEAMIVDYGIMTWVNECAGYSASSPLNPVLSHRWSQSHYIDDKQHTKRVVAGQAILRTDLLYDANGNLIIKADDFRTHLFHNIPPNYKRVSVNVEASSDGTRLQYVIEDQEVDGVVDPTINNLAEVADIEGTYSEVIEAAPGISVSELLQNLQAGALVGAASTAIGGAAGAGVAAAATITKGAFPSRTYEVNIRVQGTRRATRQGLVRVAIRAALGFSIGNLGNVVGGGDPFSVITRAITNNFFVDSSLQVGLVSKWVNLRLSYRASGVSAAILQMLGAIQRFPLLFPAASPFGVGLTILQMLNRFIADNDVPGGAINPISAYSPNFPDFLNTVTKSVGTPSDSYGPRGGSLRFGGEKGSRGSTIAHLVTSAFNPACGIPAVPDIASTFWNDPGFYPNQATN